MTNEGMQPYQRIVRDLSDQIATGRLAAGVKIPGIKALAEEYQVAAGTVQRALTELRTLGLVYSQQGRGSFVTEQASAKASPSMADSIRRLEERVDELTNRLERLEGKSS
ncbi:GntR family transcriptional regulator [Streptomyces sp. NPDC059578]|uniref:GntR family transcriptional regulator n=1 Tax=Streptomyces sp. NPDC059578 TaxID=3346874 RepID=UPI003682B1F2